MARDFLRPVTSLLKMNTEHQHIKRLYIWQQITAVNKYCNTNIVTDVYVSKLKRQTDKHLTETVELIGKAAPNCRGGKCRTENTFYPDKLVNCIFSIVNWCLVGHSSVLLD